MERFKLVRFEKAKAKNKKYSAILEDVKTKKTKRVNFGDDRYEQYEDSTGLGLYSHKDHKDEKRRAAYKSRHAKTAAVKWSPSWFSMKFLW
jgi:hypothetical protein